MQNSVVLGIGSNVSSAHVENALEWLGRRLDAMERSSLYVTPPVGGGSRPYVNAVASGCVHMPEGEFNMLLKDFEAGCGRDGYARSAGIVPVDIDIVVWNGDVVRPWDFAQSFFRIGFSELPCPPVKEQSDG